MKQFLLMLLRFYQRARNKYRWNKEYKRLIQLIGGKYNRPKIDKLKKYLIILPHSDDEWIGCGSLISNLNIDILICNADMQGGDNPEMHHIRRAEINKLASLYNRKVEVLKLDKLGSLACVLRTFTPDIVMVPFWFDWHPEHIQLLDILKDTLLFCKEQPFKVGMYQVTVPIRHENVTHISEMTDKQWKLKWKIFRENYKTQKYFPWYRVSLNEKLQGSKFGVEACEVFCIMNSNTWIESYEKFKPTKEQTIALKMAIPSLVEIRNVEQPIIVGYGKH